MESRPDPSLKEMLSDPIVVALMRRDGVNGDHVQKLIEEVRRNLRARRQRLAA